MAGKKNSCDKKIRTPRVVANPKELNRKGGRSPQPQRITNMDRVAGIQIQAYNLAWALLNEQGKLTEKIERHLWFWTGVDSDTPAYKLTDKETALVHEALTDAIRQTPDAEIAFTPKGAYAVPFAGPHPFPLGSVRKDTASRELASVG